MIDLSNVFKQLIICGLALLICPFSLAAENSHPVSVTQVYAYVEREVVDVRIEVFLEDLFLFHDLKPNDQDFLEQSIILQGVELHKEFLLQKFVMRDFAGERLVGRIVGVEKTELLPEGVALGELMAHTLVFRLKYDLERQPDFLTISQHFTDADGILPSEMNLVVKQQNAGEAHTATLKPDETDTIRFSWNNPPLSPEASEEERKKWMVKQTEETLGITSYSSVYSFLYIEDYEVRHEILIPLLTLEDSILIARDDDEFLDIAEQDAAKQQIEAFFRSGNPIEIDGIKVKPTVDRCNFYGLNFKDFAMQAKRKKVSLASARIGIILSYSTKGAPDSIKLTWNRFNNFIWNINLAIYERDDISKATLSRLGEGNVFSWRNPGRPNLPPLEKVSVDSPPHPSLSLPLISVGCLSLMLVFLLMGCFAKEKKNYFIAGCLLLLVAGMGWPFLRLKTPQPFYNPPTLSDSEADAVFSSLHKNIYRAFDYRNEEDIYDALAKSIDGELLEEVYLQIRRGLEMQEQGGAVSKVRDVEILEGDHQESGENSTGIGNRSFAYKSRWNVAGTVEHWGHIHSRTNQYEALFQVETRDNSWKITKMDLLDEERVSFETDVREL